MNKQLEQGLYPLVIELIDEMWALHSILKHIHGWFVHNKIYNVFFLQNIGGDFHSMPYLIAQTFEGNYHPF